MDIYFEQPLWFLLIPSLFIIRLILKKYKRIYDDKHKLTSIYLPSLFNVNISFTKNSRKERKSLSWLILILMTSALSQPVTKIKKHTKPESLRDIIFIIDTSVGMAIRDYSLESTPVSRLSLLKAVLTEFTQELTGNRIGLMVYADHAYTLSPLTYDKNLIAHSINQIQPAVSGRQNNISNALNSVLKQYDFKKKTPSVVLLSQGSNIDGDIDPSDIAETFKSRKIKLHTIGLGSNKKATDTTNKLIFDSIDESLLNRLSKITGGKFFWVGKTNNLNEILQSIMKSETIDLHKSEYFLIKNYYSIPLYLSLLIIILSVFQSLLVRQQR